MTGYGRGEAADADRRITVEIKSVNNRYCDVQIRMPRVLSALEARAREMAASRVARGKIDVYITYEDRSPDANRISCDTGLAHAYTAALRDLSAREGIPDGINAGLIARFNDVIQVETATAPLDVVQVLLETAVQNALDSLCLMRQLEGSRLVTDIVKRCEILENRRKDVAERAPLVVAAYRIKLTERIADLLGDKAAELVDEARLGAEIALYADKCAIDEELVRLHSHLQQLATIVSLDEPVGKKLDFLVQEINREINTIGSKANDLDLINHVVSMKSEVEKIREQVQNLE
jgi:uncharacterized protein (TIGR00255 family)